jgi:hypothetical protein
MVLVASSLYEYPFLSRFKYMLRRDSLSMALWDYVVGTESFRVHFLSLAGRLSYLRLAFDLTSNPDRIHTAPLLTLTDQSAPSRAE